MTILLPLRTRRVRRQRAPTATPASPDAVPGVARMVALAHRWEAPIRTAVVMDQAALAALVGVSRARVIQVMGLLYLGPDIQEEILDGNDLVDVLQRDLIRNSTEPVWTAQRERWRGLREVAPSRHRARNSIGIGVVTPSRISIVISTGTNPGA